MTTTSGGSRTTASITSGPRVGAPPGLGPVDAPDPIDRPQRIGPTTWRHWPACGHAYEPTEESFRRSLRQYGSVRTSSGLPLLIRPPLADESGTIFLSAAEWDWRIRDEGSALWGAEISVEGTAARDCCATFPAGVLRIWPSARVCWKAMHAPRARRRVQGCRGECLRRGADGRQNRHQ